MVLSLDQNVTYFSYMAVSSFVIHKQLSSVETLCLMIQYLVHSGTRSNNNIKLGVAHTSHGNDVNKARDREIIQPIVEDVGLACF